MNQKTLVSDLLRLEEMTTDTNLLIHIARIRERAENGFYHLAHTAELGNGKHLTLSNDSDEY